MKKQSSRQRRPCDGGELLNHLRRVIPRLDPLPVLVGKPDALTAGDRTFIATVLRKILTDEDPREYFWETINHRVHADDGALGYSIAFVYWAKIRLGESKAGKALRGEIADCSGLSDTQVEHAVRSRQSNAKNALVMIDVLDGDRPALIKETKRHLAQLSRPMRRKK